MLAAKAITPKKLILAIINSKINPNGKNNNDVAINPNCLNLEASGYLSS
jgi:hypothetical protein